MRRRGRELSCREQGLIDGFIKEVCRALNCSDKGDDLYQSAWAAFLGVYRDSPSSFYFTWKCGLGIPPSSFSGL